MPSHPRTPAGPWRMTRRAQADIGEIRPAFMSRRDTMTQHAVATPTLGFTLGQIARKSSWKKGERATSKKPQEPKSLVPVENVDSAPYAHMLRPRFVHNPR